MIHIFKTKLAFSKAIIRVLDLAEKRILFPIQGGFLAKKLNNRIDNLDNKQFLESISVLFPFNLSDVSIFEREMIIASANKLLENKFDLLGSGQVTLDPINWHSDFKSGFTWEPGTYYLNYNQVNISNNADVKIPRELSRCHHFLHLGLAFYWTRNDKYAEKIKSQIINWINENPLMYSINWGCSMDVAIRAVNWIWSISLINNYGGLDLSFITHVKESLYQHGWFIYKNPEGSIFDYNHNHYLSDISGLVQIGILFSKTAQGQKWLKDGIQILFREIRTEILPSGMSFERSTNYNRLVIELILTPIVVLRNNGYEIPQDIWYRIEQMFGFVLYSLKPDGHTPIIGDQDNGRMLPLGCESVTDFRYLLSIATLLFDRGDFKNYGNGYNIYCAFYCYDKTKVDFNSIQKSGEEISTVFYPDAGLYVLREKRNYLIFNASGKGQYPENSFSTHTHSDLLSFELFINDKTFLIDPGSYVYSADPEQKLLFRSTKMHNTVVIDGENQNDLNINSLWDFPRNAIPLVLQKSSTAEKDIVIAQHSGYLRLKDPISHIRKIEFDKYNETWVITDSLVGNGHHLIELFFHFDVEIDFFISGQSATTLSNGTNIMLEFLAKKPLVLKKTLSYVSESYGVKKEAFVLTVSIDTQCPISIITKITKIN